MDPKKLSLFQTYEKPRGEGGSNSFATFMIIGPVFFFLGMLFSSFPYDYPLLWTSEATPDAYYDQLETHLKFIHASPPIIARILHIVITAIKFEKEQEEKNAAKSPKTGNHFTKFGSKKKQ
ncbi:hypothetical protein BUE80_DR003303 [Diplocarpon rosae]|nr:hypothetical protein BUE80_DR003303 [Diplocarpon rosae]